MSYRKLISVLASLSPEAQRQVADFVAHLKQQNYSARRLGKQNGAVLSRQFIGMWADRQDMKDASAWVRKRRKQEWLVLKMPLVTNNQGDFRFIKSLKLLPYP
jgi:hypothetical protein